jgi:hypothetical protein
MALINKLKTVLDQPVWEWTRFAPTNTSAISYLATSDDGSDRYLYYIVGSLFYRYDCISDTWMQLASPIVTPVTTVALRYSKYAGNRGRVISNLTSTKIRIPYISGGKELVGKTIKIIAGTGAGQEKTINAVDAEFIHDSGLATSATANLLTDTTKKWKINQWVGYTCRVTYNTSATLQRTVIYNTVDTLTFADSNYQAYEPFDNQGFSVTPSITAGVQTHFVLTTQDITVNSAFSVTPDDTSRFLLETGVLWLLSSATSNPFFTWQMYDVANDMWIAKTATGGMLTAALGTDCAFERTGEVGGSFLSGTATAGANRTLTDSSKNMTVDRYANYQIRITGGTGVGQRRRIQANGVDYFEVAKKWDINPDATSTYSIYADTDNIYMMGNGQSAMYKYSVEADLWSTGQIYDYGVTSNTTVRKNGTLPYGIASGVRNTGGITAVAVNAAGSGYRIGDVITVSGGTNGKVFVETINATGGVLTVSLMRPGSGYSVTTGAATTSGTGTGLTINISTVGVVGYVTTTISHPFKIGDSVTIAGATESAWNTTYTIIGSDAATTFDIALTATASLTASSSQSGSLIVDASANWDVNEHTGKLICVQPAGTAGAAQWRRIASNTATTITLSSAITAPTSGTSRYLIQDTAAFGGDNQFQRKDQAGTGAATSGSTTTLVDSTKNWVPGSWVGYRVRIIAGTGLGSEIAITANTETTLTYATQTFTPDTTTRYRIMDVYGIATGGSTTTLIDTTKNWKVNQWAGKRVRFISGAGQTIEQTITSNTATTLTFATTTSPDTTTNYTIYGIPPRGSGINIIWTFGMGHDKYLWVSRGSASNTFDIYDITLDSWEYGFFLTPQTETLTTGSMYAYDENSRIYFTKDSTGRIYYIDIEKRAVVNSGTIPYGMSTAIIGNRMEIVQGPDGLQFLYIMRHTGNEMWRTLLFW